MPVSSPENQVFSDLFFYYHGAGGGRNIPARFRSGFLQGSPDAHKSRSTSRQRKGGITNMSVLDAVTSTPGTYDVTFDVVATSVENGRRQPIRDRGAGRGRCDKQTRTAVVDSLRRYKMSELAHQWR